MDDMLSDTPQHPTEYARSSVAAQDNQVYHLLLRKCENLRASLSKEHSSGRGDSSKQVRVDSVRTQATSLAEQPYFWYDASVKIETAHAAAHARNTYLSAQYHRLSSQRGKKKAIIAFGHTILVSISHLLRDQKVYQEAGGNYFDEQDRQATENRLVRRLEKLSYQVSLTFISPAASTLFFRRMSNLTAMSRPMELRANLS
jgi:hypothetical protein